MKAVSAVKPPARFCEAANWLRIARTAIIDTVKCMSQDLDLELEIVGFRSFAEGCSGRVVKVSPCYHVT